MNRYPHLPPPEVCDWLLEQGWSGVIPETVITYPKGNPEGITRSERFDYCSATVAAGADEICHVSLPVEVLEVLKADQRARREAIERKRAAMEPDELERKSERDLGRQSELGVLPMIVSETGADDEPETERIICCSISGGADYVDGMPRELRLQRIMRDGELFARYIQESRKARPGEEPDLVPVPSTHPPMGMRYR